MRIAELLKRFLLLCAAACPAGAAVLGLMGGWRGAAAFALTFLLVGGDFWWMSLGVAKLMGLSKVPEGATRWFLMGLVLRSLLLLLGIYGIFLVLPKESLGVLLGIATPLILLVVAGAMPARG